MWRKVCRVFATFILCLSQVSHAAAEPICPDIFTRLAEALRLTRPSPPADAAFQSERSRIEREFVGKFANLDGRLGPASADQLRSIALWSAYSTSFQVTTRSNILRNSELYKSAITDGHPHIRFLEKIGYRFEVAANGKLEITVPPLETAIRSYEAIMKEHVANGRIKAEDVLIPMRAFKAGEEVVFLRYGDAIPKGATPYDDILSDADFATIAKAGGFIISESKSDILLSNLHSALEHDLGHLSGYAEFPEFQTQIALFNRSAETVSRNGKRHGFSQRSSYLNEFLEGVGVENREQLTDIFKRHGIRTMSSSNGRAARTLEYRLALQFKSDKQIKDLLSELRANWYQLVKKPGAAVRDIADQEYYRRVIQDPSIADANVGFYARQRRVTLDNRLQAVLTGSRVDKKQVAELLTALDNTSHFQFDEIVKQSANAKIDRNSALYIFLCTNRLSFGMARIGYCPSSRW